MAEVSIYTISRLRSGDYKIVRSSASGNEAAPITLDRVAMELYFSGRTLVRGTLTGAWDDLDRIGIVEFSVIE
jgi:hypothetical protein